MQIGSRRVVGLIVLAAGFAACSPSADDGRATTDSTPEAPSGPAGGQALASPRGTASDTIGGASVVVDYGRPSRRGRRIFGALVPYDRVWRTGANSATTLVLGGPVELGGKSLDAGAYSIYSIPSAGGWTLVINGQTGQWGTEYNETQDVIRLPMAVSRAPVEVDTFTITVEGGAEEGRLVFAWDTLQAVASIRPR